jgi:hypothetical protein
MFFAPPNTAHLRDETINPTIHDLFNDKLMNNYVKVAALADVPIGGSKLVEVNRVRVALFNLDGDNLRHRGRVHARQRPARRGHHRQRLIRCSARATVRASTFAPAPR